MTTADVVESLAHDARYAVRGLRRSPLFAFVPPPSSSGGLMNLHQ